MNVQTVADAFKAALEVIEGVEIYSHVPPKPVLPAIIVFPERVPYPVTQESTFIVWCIGGDVESEGAQARLADWFSDDSPNSVYTAVTADNSLGGAVSSVLPVEMRQWGIVSLADGRRVVQAQLVCSVWR